MLLRLDVEDSDDLVVPRQRHGHHRGDEASLVEAADPQEARVHPDVGDHERLARGGNPSGDALAVRHPGPADLETVETGRRRQRQVRSIAVEQVERGDIGVERVAGAVDDRLEELVPRPRRRRETGDMVEKAELLELARFRATFEFRHCHDGHDTSLRKVGLPKGCGTVKPVMRNGVPRPGAPWAEPAVSTA